MLPGITTITKASIAYADNKRRSILAEIKEDRFDYATHFPDSAKGAVLSGTSGAIAKRTVAEGMAVWLDAMKAKKAGSTSTNYGYKAKHVTDWAGPRRIVDVSKSDIELFQARLPRAGLGPKSVNDVFTIVRGV